MKGFKKSKRVTWAQGANLCQVLGKDNLYEIGVGFKILKPYDFELPLLARLKLKKANSSQGVKLFLSEDCPSKVCVEAQHRHQSKTLNSNVPSFDKFPAWYVNPSRGRARIPQIKWKCPPEFALDINWCVAAGEESQDVKVQEDRETKVLEAVYPRLSAIPPCPSVSMDEEGQCYDDRCTPLIPIIPIEEAEGAAEQLPSDVMASLILPMNSNSPALSQGPPAAATHNISQCMKSQPPSHGLGPSTSADVTITSPPLSISQGPSTSAASNGPQFTMNSQLPSLPHHPDTSAAPSITHCMMKSQLPSLSQHPSTSATLNISQHTMVSQLPSLSLSSTTSATSCIPQFGMNAQPASISQLPSAFASPVIAQCSMNSQPPSLPQGPLTSTNLHISHCNTTGSQNLPACEKSLTFDGLDGHVVDAVAAAASVMAKSKEEGSLIDTNLLIKILRDPKMIEKLIEEHGLASHTKTETASGSNPGPSSVSLPSSMLDLSIKKATNEHNEPANSRTQAISRSVIASQSLPLPSRKTELVVSKSIEEHGIEAMSIPVSRTQSLPLHSRKPERLPGKLIEDHVRADSAIDTKAISRPVIPLSNPSTKTEVVPGKLIENHGQRHAGTSPVNGPKPAVIPVPMPPSKLDASSIGNFYLGKEKGESACTKTQPISRPVISHQLHALPSSKAEVLDNKSIEEHGWSHVAPVVYRTKPMAKSASLLLPKPEVSLGKTSVNEYRPSAPAGTVHVAGIKSVTPLVPPIARPDMEKLKELINEYGAPDSAGQKSLPSGRPDVEMLKKMINDYGAPDNAGQKSLPSGGQNVEMFKKMMDEYGAPDNAGQKSLPASEPTFPPFSRAKSDMLASPRSNLYSMPNALLPNMLRESLSPSPVNTPPFSSLTTPSAPPLKDIHYYKSLIKQHGEKHESWDHDHLHYVKPRNPLQGLQLVREPTERNARHKKPCMYFHSSKGCRNGSSCPYLHDDTPKLSRSGSVLETPGTKRIKLVGNS